MRKDRPLRYFSTLYDLVWTLFGSAIIYLWPSLYLHELTWSLYADQTVAQLLFTGAHLIFGLVLTFFIGRPQVKFRVYPVFLYGFLWGVALFILYLLRLVNFSRFVLLGSLALSLLFFLLTWVTNRWFSSRARKISMGLLVCLLLGLISVVLVIPGSWLEATRNLSRYKPEIQQHKFLFSTFYQLNADYFHHYIPFPNVVGGGLVAAGEDMLLVTGDGLFYRLHDLGNDLQVRPLALRVPINHDAFARDVSSDIKDTWFRVAGIHLEPKDDAFQIWVSHHHWDPVEKLIHVRVSTITGSLEDFEREAANERWHTLYETSPGLPFIENPRSGNPFIGVEIGGRIQTLDEQHLLLSLGDQGFDGWETTLAISQDLSSPFGKTMKIDKQTGEAKLYSMGHRNPQGLCVATDGSVWSTEHGPKGGDELNLIQEGKNYGWPIVTLGANYFDTIWPLSSNQSSHDGYEYPVYSWLPSIGISNLIQVKGSPMPIWRGDLLVSSLAAGTVYHVRLHDGRVLFSEPLDIGKRIRDIAEGANGNVYLWTDSADFVRISPVEMVEKTGETLFAQCLVCHSQNLHGLYAIGPSLEGVFGRKIASLPDFQYTAGMKSVKGRWNSENLDAFIENPQVFAHGTTMVSPHLTSEDRQRLLVYLKSY